MSSFAVSCTEVSSSNLPSLSDLPASSDVYSSDETVVVKNQTNEDSDIKNEDYTRPIIRQPTLHTDDF
ncbi:MAG: hypothetical protein WBI55_00225 [Eubacteriales bacterium]|jgi:hypothetical protein|nr:hypothetical protein [Clostridiales bacterium]